MANVLFNGADFPRVLDPSPLWVDVLADIDARIADSGEIVTAVRFDGVEEPAFRDAAVTARRLGPHTVVEIDTGEPSAFLESCLADVCASLPALELAASEIAARFRSVAVDEANRDLADLADSLGTIVALVATASLASGVALDEVRAGDRTVAQSVADLHAMVDALVEAQRAGDWITVADTLQYDIAPLLAAWPDVFGALANAASRGRPLPKSA